jgi:3-phenylpropionate/trans-cinnamate dioxygenase ferredoxin subunit
MSNKQIVGEVKDFPLGSITKVEIDDLEIALVNSPEGFFAVNDICTHAEVSLSDGTLNGCLLECPMHGAEFDIKTGEAKTLPANKPLEVYQVFVDGTDENAKVSIEVGK